MQKIIYLLLLFVITTNSFAQQIKSEVISTTHAGENSRSNSDTVPAALVINGQFERIIIVRLKHQTDILIGLDSVVKQQNIKNAAILSGIGSVCNYHYHVVSNRTFPTHNVFIKDTTGSANLLNINGYIINGRIHAHLILSDANKSFGGHLEPGTTVFTFVIITIGILKDDIDLSRVDDSTYR